MTDMNIITSSDVLNDYADACADMQNTINHQADELTRLRAEVEALRVDAGRYRWLRDTGAVFTVRSSGSLGETCTFVAINRPAHGLNEAVDRAMKDTP